MVNARLAEFVTERCVVGEREEVPVAAFWAAWLAHAEAKGWRPGTKVWTFRYLRMVTPCEKRRRLVDGRSVGIIHGVSLRR